MQDLFVPAASSSSVLLPRNAMNLYFKLATHVPVNPLNRLSLALPNLTVQGRKYCQRTLSQTARHHRELCLLLMFLRVGLFSLHNRVAVRMRPTLFLVVKKLQLFKAKTVLLSLLSVTSRNVDCFQVSPPPFLIT